MKLCNSCDGIYSSLDVRFTKACDNNCEFCIEKTGIDTLGKTSVNKMISATIKSGIKNILILGGEPFLDASKLLEYIMGIEKYADEIYITTSLPNTFIHHRSICEQIVKRVTGLNVSIQSEDYRKNNQILNATKKHDRIKILERLNKKYGDKIRTSINLSKGGIDTKEKIIKALDKLSEIGCEKIKINELQHTNKYISYQDIMGIKMKSPYYHGCNTWINDYKNMKILLKRSCFVVEEKQKATIKDFIKAIYKATIWKPKNKFKVLYENGEIKNGWEVKNVN
jgi:molybdenum cofactor biosynthesis enzyme MoaA